MYHELKTHPKAFAAVMSGDKRHEIRKQDRPFAVGDVLRLREWDPDTQRYTGHETSVDVLHLTGGGEWGLPPKLCVMSIGKRWGEDDLFVFEIISRPDQYIPHVTILCVDTEGFGSIASALAWLHENAKSLIGRSRLVIVAHGEEGGDWSNLPPGLNLGITERPRDPTPEGWRDAINTLAVGAFYPNHQDRLDPAETMGGVPMEVFEERLRAYNADECDDGATC